VIPFDMVEPTSLKEAISLLDPEEPTVRPVAGGTALMLMMKAGVFQPSLLVCLHKIEPEHSKITAANGGLKIGAMATLSDLEHDANIAAKFPVLRRAMKTLSNPRVRNVARVGGALAHGDPHMDLPPVLTMLGAKVAITGPKGDRELPLEDLFVGYYETALKKDELTSRNADDWPALGVAVSFALEGGTIKDPRVIISAATEKVTRIASAEKELQGAKPDDAVLERAGEAAVAEATILSDAHGSAPYKRELLRVYMRRAVRQAIEGA
jgi:carbon-monoxide dehydrogenase medium subunit